METAKFFDISKTLVWKAYLRVRSRKGAPGVDEESIEKFEENLKDNLYKLWNRMSSGSYFPAPVRRVEIPKKTAGVRLLGIPTVADRIAQTVVKMSLKPILAPHFHDDSYGYRPMVIGRIDRQSMLWESRANGVGVLTGCSISR